nr:ankyrin repeat-containing protein [Tanacetum cinerariifolium]
MENRFTAELGAIKTELITTITSSISAAMEQQHEVWMKMLSLEGGHHGSDYRMRKLKMPLFDGEDFQGSIYKVERYFEVQDIEPGEQLRAAVLCMEGQALAWFRWSEARSPFRSWEGLKRRLLERFQPSHERTLYEQFLAITQ